MLALSIEQETYQQFLYIPSDLRHFIFPVINMLVSSQGKIPCVYQ